MIQNSDFDIQQIKDFYQIDPERLALARNRQSRVWQGQQPDKWPLLMSAPLTASQEGIPAPDFPEAFTDPKMMLCQQMRTACAVANAESDSVPSIRANTGTATLMACFGLEQEVHPGQMPWLQQHMTPEEAGRLTPDDIKIQGAFARALDFIAFFREILGDRIDIFVVDTQGPFDLAHLLIGDEIFYLLYDDPVLMHSIMEVCTELYIRATKAVKNATGEPYGSSAHSARLYAPNAGVRICEDTTTLVGRDTIEEFVLPYTLRVAEEFGGAWVHFCGRCDLLRDLLCDCELIKGLNYGVIPGKEDDFDFDRDIDILATAGKAYFGDIPRQPLETGEDYLRRLHRYASRGHLIPKGDAAVGGESGFQNVAQALDFWYSLPG